MLTSKAKQALRQDIGMLVHKIIRDNYTPQEMALMILTQLQVLVNLIDTQDD